MYPIIYQNFKQENFNEIFTPQNFMKLCGPAAL